MVTPYKDVDSGKKEQVERMFDNIAPKYDLLNRVLSLGIDVWWRKRALSYLREEKPQVLLDVATGTADVAIMAAKILQPTKIVGVDISRQMLDFGQVKIEDQRLDGIISLVQGDSEHLKFDDQSFDAATVAFGVRNFANLDKGIKEIARVLKPTGVLVILETSNPTKFPFKQGYKLYTNFILPLVGKLFSKDKSAYAYLSESASVFPHGEMLNNILRKIGFIEVKNRPQTMGVATIYSASK